MLVQTIEHGLHVRRFLASLWESSGRRHLAIDTETKAVRPYPANDALTIGRATILIWSICYNGASYSFPTSVFNSKYPTMRQWADALLWPWFLDKRLTMVAHNWNYDANVFSYDAGLPLPALMWDSMIGCWLAAEYLPKGLKDRAPTLGRFLRETKSVDFSNTEELSDYAEQDVVAAEEFYLVQRYGQIRRPSLIVFMGPNGRRQIVKNDQPTDPFVPENQDLNEFGRRWLQSMEFPVLRSTIRAEQRGLPFNLPRLHAIRDKVVATKKVVLKELFRAGGCRFNPNSGRDLARIVEHLGINYPFVTKKTGVASFTAANLGKMEDAHPFFKMLMRYKKLEKLTAVYIGTTRCNEHHSNDCGLERWVSPTTGAIHATAGTIEAVTGRGSSSRPNLQQIPVRDDQFSVRSVFTASAVGDKFNIYAPRYTFRRSLSVLDYSQLELRIMALLSKDKAMTKILSDRKGDIHQHTADEFGVTRAAAKNLNFLLLYGGQEYMLSEQLTKYGSPTDVATATQYKERHWQVYPRVKAKREEWCVEHQRNGFVRLFLGRRRTLPDADWSNSYTTHRAETQISNNVVQGSGQDFLKASIIRSDYQGVNPDRLLSQQPGLAAAHRAYLKDRAKALERIRRTLRLAQCRFLLQIHDEVMYSQVPEAEEECLHLLADVMTWFHFMPGTSSYNVPLVAEGGVGYDWVEAKSKTAKVHVTAGFDHFHKYVW